MISVDLSMIVFEYGTLENPYPGGLFDLFI